MLTEYTKNGLRFATEGVVGIVGIENIDVTPQQFVDAALSGDYPESFKQDIRDNRKEAEQLIAGILGLM